ncbi:MAG: hypothetical protein U9N49_10360 [Campylobacterota bacterium]|nr:hypothetical protein [Campylobacterota bacterium]
MKKCPQCKNKTIPLRWILFHQLSKKSCNYFECSKCGEKIRTGHLVNFSMISLPLYDPIILAIILFALYYSFGLLTLAVTIVSYLVAFILLFFIQQYFVPLEISVETECETKGLTRIQALFALVLMVGIIGVTLYELVAKPLL